MEITTIVNKKRGLDWIHILFEKLSNGGQLTKTTSLKYFYDLVLLLLSQSNIKNTKPIEKLKGNERLTRKVVNKINEIIEVISNQE